MTTNHWWNVPLYVTVRGLTTSLMPHPTGPSFEIDFEFVAHRLEIVTMEGESRVLPLRPRPVAEFYAEVMALLAELGMATTIWPVPGDSKERSSIQSIYLSHKRRLARRPARRRLRRPQSCSPPLTDTEASTASRFDCPLGLASLRRAYPRLRTVPPGRWTSTFSRGKTNQGL